MNAKACLISGSPGIGKSATVHILAKMVGYSVKCINASDKRSKLVINDLLKDLSTNTSMNYYQIGVVPDKSKKNAIILMDEVDGMDGNADWGGIQALIKIIEKTNSPVICIANDY